MKLSRTITPGNHNWYQNPSKARPFDRERDGKELLIHPQPSNLMKKLAFVWLLFTCLGQSFGQGCEHPRYFDEIFSSVAVTSNLKFGENLQPTALDPNNIQELFLDVYEPQGDTVSARPLIIWAFGGGFIFGDKGSSDIVTLSNTFAKRGYVCAAIDYRLSPDLAINGDVSNVYEAVWKAMHDMRASIRYFYKEAASGNSFRIDTSKIFIGGVSAGAITALQITHFDEEDEVPTEMESLFQSTGGFEGNSGNPGYSDDVAGVVSLCGAVLDTAWVNPAIPTPIVSMHGTADSVVPYGSDTLTLLGISLAVDGSASIHAKLDQLGIKNDFYPWQDANHTPFVLNPASEAEAYMDTTIAFVRDFLYDLICDDVTSVVPMAINEELAFEVFPNPNGGNFTLRLPSAEEVKVVVYDPLGRTIAADRKIHRGLNQFELNLPPGMYTVCAYSKERRMLLSQKVIVR